MRTSPRIHLSLMTGLLVWLWLLVSPSWAAAPESALADYVNTPDPAYGYTAVETIPGAGFTLHVLTMNSQQWRAPGEVDRSLWTHWLAIVVPDVVSHETGMVIVGGGDNGGPPDLGADEVVFGAQIAVLSQSIVAIVGQIPNQPLVVPDAAVPLREDALVAYSWDKAMGILDWSWPAYLPMVKSVVRTFDTVQDFVPTVSAARVDDFVLVGFSKRGATTWLTAAVDPRVRGIVPGVIDFLNLAPSIEHHFRAYGEYSSAISDYVDYDIVRRVRTPEGQDLLSVVDPYAYRSVLDMPKYLLNSTGDQFFLPDSARFYIDDLPGETLLRYVANTDHGLSGPTVPIEDAVTGLISWYLTLLLDVPRPQIDWTYQDGQLVVRTSQAALVARLWQADNPTARDFRLATLGPAWTVTPLAGSAGEYVAEVESPPTGWRGFYIELTFAGPGGLPQTYSTPVFVTPDTLPFELDDPIGNPRSPFYWAAQLQAAKTGGSDIDAATISGWFPFPVTGEVVHDLDEAEAILAPWQPDATARARRQCLATRLNIAAGELGWYSRPAQGLLHRDAAEMPYLWRWWQRADTSWRNGHPRLANLICRYLNQAEVFEHIPAGQAGVLRRFGLADRMPSRPWKADSPN